jgi:precorrin-6B methylase 2
VENITIIAGEAPECLADIPPLDGVIIGGSGGKILEIIKAARGLLKPGARVVLNTILLDSLHTAVAALEEEGFLEVDLLAVNISRGRLLGSGRALQPLNPVFIIWGTQPGREEIES